MRLKFVLCANEPADVIGGLRTEIVRRLEEVHRQQTIAQKMKESSRLAGCADAYNGMLYILDNLIIEPKVETGE